MNLTDQEKDELFTDFMVRMTQMDSADKRIAVAQNNSAMKGLQKYYVDITDRYAGGKTDKNAWLYRQFDGWWFWAADGLYDAYLALRKAIPFIVGVKRALDGTRPTSKNQGYKKRYVLDPQNDRAEVEKIGKALMDVMFNYLKEAPTDDT